MKNTKYLESLLTSKELEKLNTLRHRTLLTNFRSKLRNVVYNNNSTEDAYATQDEAKTAAELLLASILEVAGPISHTQIDTPFPKDYCIWSHYVELSDVQTTIGVGVYADDDDGFFVNAHVDADRRQTKKT